MYRSPHSRGCVQQHRFVRLKSKAGSAELLEENVFVATKYFRELLIPHLFREILVIRVLRIVIASFEELCNRDLNQETCHLDLAKSVKSTDNA